MKLWCRNFLLAALIIPSIACASALQQFKAFVSTTHSASGGFEQHQISKESSKKNTLSPSDGRFSFLRPGKFIWEYQKPYQQLILSDGTNLNIYDQDLNQVTIKKLGSALASSPAAILFGSNDIEKNFVLTEGIARAGIEWLDVVPKNHDTNFTKIRIGMKSGLPMSMELHDSFGQVSVLKFIQFKKNSIVSAKDFQFAIPKGADVLRE